MAVASKTAETDLFAPVRDHFASQGFAVQGEVKKSDAACVRDGELVIVEMKLALNAAVLAQASQRQEIADRVYVAILKPKELRQWRARSKGLLYLLRRLELGLLFVSPRARTAAKVVVEHEALLFDRVKDGKLRSRVMREVVARQGDFNQGGSVATRIVSAYRETAIHIACCLSKHGALTGSQLKSLGTGRTTFAILERASDRDGWFERDDEGRYSRTKAGGRLETDYPEVARHFTAQLVGKRRPRAKADE